MINALDQRDTAPWRGIENCRNECGDRGILKIWIMETRRKPTLPPPDVYIRVVIYLVDNVSTTIPLLRAFKGLVLGLQSL